MFDACHLGNSHKSLLWISSLKHLEGYTAKSTLYLYMFHLLYIFCEVCPVKILLYWICAPSFFCTFTSSLLLCVLFITVAYLPCRHEPQVEATTACTKAGWRIKLAICWLKSFFCCCCLQMALSTIKWSLFHPNKYICLFHKKISNLANCVVRHMSTAEARHAIEWCVCESYVVVSLWNFCTSCFSMLQWWLCLGTLRDNEVKSDVEIP